MLFILMGAALLAAGAPDPLKGLPPVPSGAVRLFLVRHGQALSNLDPAPKLPPAQLDHLTALGREQASRAGTALKGHGVRIILTSPAERGRETAEVIRLAVGVGEATVEPRLRPLSLGFSPDGKALDWDARIAEWKKGRDPVPEAGESMEQVGARVAALAAELARNRPGQEVLLVAHSEVIGAFVGHVEGTAPALRYPPGIANGSITVVEAWPDRPARIVLKSVTPPGP